MNGKERHIGNSAVFSRKSGFIMDWTGVRGVVGDVSCRGVTGCRENSYYGVAVEIRWSRKTMTSGFSEGITGGVERLVEGIHRRRFNKL